MKTLLLLLLSAGLATASDLTDLQAKYNKASAKALEPVNAVYTGELQKLLEKYSKDGNIEEVAKITEELKKFTVSTDTKVKTVSFLKKHWVSNIASVFTFNKDGTGEKEYFGQKTPFTWKLISDNFLEVTDTGKLRFFRFLDNSKGLYGEAKDNLDKVITSK